MHRFSDDLAQRPALQLYRTRRVLESPQGVEVRIGGETLLSFCSNDYLGLANDTRVIEAFRQAALDYGVGSGASHLVTGHALPHHALEEECPTSSARRSPRSSAGSSSCGPAP